MKLFGRVRSGKKSGGKLFRYGWKITLIGLVAAGGLFLFLFYAGWAATFDMKKVGEMPERNTVFDFDGKNGVALRHYADFFHVEGSSPSGIKEIGRAHV